jgi:hypothetical protein
LPFYITINKLKRVFEYKEALNKIINKIVYPANIPKSHKGADFPHWIIPLGLLVNKGLPLF